MGYTILINCISNMIIGVEIGSKNLLRINKKRKREKEK
jgi:hypothetical protein